MNILSTFGIGAKKILAMNCCTTATVTAVRNSRIHVVKKPVRIGINDANTMFSHYMFFTYTVDSIPYEGMLYVDLAYRCPQAGEHLEVYYDPEDPSRFAFYPFGPNPKPLGW